MGTTCIPLGSSVDDGNPDHILVRPKSPGLYLRTFDAGVPVGRARARVAALALTRRGIRDGVDIYVSKPGVTYG